MNDDLVRKVNETVRDDRRFTISDLSLHFLQISRTLLSGIVSIRLGYWRPHSEEGKQKLVPRYDKCLNNGGEYVEKNIYKWPTNCTFYYIF